MLQKNDLILLLTELQQNGEDVSTELTKVVTSSGISLEVVKFINDRRQFDVASFYEKMRKNHNDKKSPLYKNIVKDVEDVNEIITTLHAYALQVNLFAKHLENKQLFFKHARAEEVARVLDKYYTDFDITSALKLIRLIKADIVAFETVAGRR